MQAQVDSQLAQVAMVIDKVLMAPSVGNMRIGYHCNHQNVMVDTRLNQVIMIIDNVLVKPNVDYKRVVVIVSG